MTKSNHHLIRDDTTVIQIIQFHPRRWYGCGISEILLNIGVETVPELVVDEVNRGVMHRVVGGGLNTDFRTELVVGGHDDREQDLRA